MCFIFNVINYWFLFILYNKKKSYDRKNNFRFTLAVVYIAQVSVTGLLKYGGLPIVILFACAM
jgi:hypothetical protein